LSPPHLQIQIICTNVDFASVDFEDVAQIYDQICT
jgi:hypothetical protein